MIVKIIFFFGFFLAAYGLVVVIDYSRRIGALIIAGGLLVIFLCAFWCEVSEIRQRRASQEIAPQIETQAQGAGREDAETQSLKKPPENARDRYAEILACEVEPEAKTDCGEWDAPEPVETQGEPAETAPVYDADAVYIAKTIGVEAPYCSRAEQAAVAWTILNRVDDPRFPSTVAEVVTAPYQFAYFPHTPLRADLYELALDVLARWAREAAGETDVGRVLPREYLYYTGDGYHNYFRVRERQGAAWDWSLEDPYV